MKRFTKIAAWFCGILFLLLLLFVWMIHIPTPKVNDQINPQSFTRVQLGPNHYAVNNNWLKKNRYGVWEMYLEGDAYQRGVIYGVLAKELMEEQESYFVNQIDELIPNHFYQQFLKYFVAWFNKDIYKHIPDENLQEIYGISLSFSDKYDYIGPKYYRILNYHAAHDIGHALNDFHLVGCTSFSVNKEFSADSSLLIARNFDFYMGDDFAKEKLIVFINPSQGYKFASYSWAGLTGVVSGMNEKGLTVTINASKSDIPFGSKDPISLLAREILQYASNTKEAIAIAEKRKTFVSESLMIGSAFDHQSLIIEKSPSKMDVFQSSSNLLICANHYQGDDFKNDSANINNISNSDSKFRRDRMNELISMNKPINPQLAVNILRNKEGLGNKAIGYGNPKALNQLIAHHGIVFKPEQRKMWISSSTYQLGEFICYDLNKVFSGDTGYLEADFNISKDPFINSTDFQKYELFKSTKQHINKFAMFGITYYMEDEAILTFINNNPNSYITFMVLGDYFKKLKSYSRAMTYYEESLKKEVGSENERNKILENIEICKKEVAK